MSLPVVFRRAARAEFDDAADWYEAPRLAATKADPARRCRLSLAFSPGRETPPPAGVENGGGRWLTRGGLRRTRQRRRIPPTPCLLPRLLRQPLGILKGSGSGVRGGMAVSLTEVLPEVQALSRLDKIRLIQFLAQDLEQDEGGLIEPGRSYPVWSPDQAFTAAATLLQALEEEKGQP